MSSDPDLIKKRVDIKVSNYTDVLDETYDKSNNFMKKMMESQQTPEYKFTFTIDPKDNTIDYFSKDGLHKVATAKCVLIARIEDMEDPEGNKMTMWRWGHSLKNWSTNYKEIANVLPLLPEEFSEFKNAPVMAVSQILGDIMVAIIVRKMAFEHVEFAKMGPTKQQYVVGLKNIQFINKPVKPEITTIINQMTDVLKTDKSENLPGNVGLSKIE